MSFQLAMSFCTGAPLCQSHRCHDSPCPRDQPLHARTSASPSCSEGKAFCRKTDTRLASRRLRGIDLSKETDGAGHTIVTHSTHHAQSQSVSLLESVAATDARRWRCWLASRGAMSSAGDDRQDHISTQPQQQTGQVGMKIPATQ